MRHFLAALPLVVVGVASAADVTSTWIGGATGNWNVATNWSRNGVPNNGANLYFVVIDGNAGAASDVVLTNLSPTISTLTIGGNDSLTIANGLTFTLAGGSLSNDGLLLQNSTGSTTDFKLGVDATFSGAGVFRGSNTLANRFYGASGAVRLTNNAPHTIAGSYQFGVNQLRLSNAGLINADSSQGISMDLVDGAAVNFNIGTLRASSGAKLTLANWTVENAGGVIEAAADSFVDLSSMTVNGGTIRDADGPGAGFVRNTNLLFLNGVTLDGPFLCPNGTTLHVQGAMQFLDTINVSSAGSTTDITLDSTPFTLSGGGEMLFTNTQANRIYGVNGGVVLTIPSDFTFHGSCQLGVNQLRLINQSVIDADTSQGITVDLVDGAGINFNPGTLRASNGAKLTVQNWTVENAGGLIEAAAGSSVDLSSMTVNGGTIRDADGPGAGFVRNMNSLFLNGVTLDGPFLCPNGTTLRVLNTLDFNSNIDVASTGSTTDVIVQTTPFTLNGGGELVFSNTQANRLYGVNGGIRIINAVGNTIRGSLSFGANQCGFTNNGLVLVDASQGMTMDFTDNQDFTNNGVLWAQNGNIVMNPFPFTNTGVVLIDAGRTLTRTGNFTQTDGGTTVNGVLTLSGGGALLLQGGQLAGSGSVGGGLVNNSGGTVAPGNSAGMLTAGASYTQGVGGTLAVQIGGLTAGTQHDRLVVTGNASLAGTLNVTRINGFVPSPGDEFTILTTTGTRTGTFGAIESCDGVSAIYGSNFVKVVFTGTFGAIGDLNNDGVVNASDLAGLLGAWGPCVELCCVADLNGDGEVNAADLATLLGNWS